MATNAKRRREGRPRKPTGPRNINGNPKTCYHWRIWSVVCNTIFCPFRPRIRQNSRQRASSAVRRSWKWFSRVAESIWKVIWSNYSVRTEWTSASTSIPVARMWSTSRAISLINLCEVYRAAFNNIPTPTPSSRITITDTDLNGEWITSAYGPDAPARSSRLSCRRNAS